MRILFPIRGYIWLYLESFQPTFSFFVPLNDFSLKSFPVDKGKKNYLHYSKGSEIILLLEDTFTSHSSAFPML